MSLLFVFAAFAAILAWAVWLLRAADGALSRRAGRGPLAPEDISTRAAAWVVSTAPAALLAALFSSDLGDPPTPPALEYLRDAALLAGLHAVAAAGAAVALHRGGRSRRPSPPRSPAPCCRPAGRHCSPGRRHCGG